MLTSETVLLNTPTGPKEAGAHARPGAAAHRGCACGRRLRGCRSHAVWCLTAGNSGRRIWAEKQVPCASGLLEAAAAARLRRACVVTSHATACSCPDGGGTLSSALCGTEACASFISSIDDHTFADVKAGLQVPACRWLQQASATVRVVRALPLLCSRCVHLACRPVLLPATRTHIEACQGGSRGGQTNISGCTMRSFACCRRVNLLLRHAR